MTFGDTVPDFREGGDSDGEENEELFAPCSPSFGAFSGLGALARSHLTPIFNEYRSFSSKIGATQLLGGRGRRRRSGRSRRRRSAGR